MIEQRVALARVATVIALILLAPVSAAPQGQKTSTAPANWTAPKTPWGHPDLQGIYSNSTIVPLERPADQSKAELSDAEVDARVQQYKETLWGKRAGDTGFYNDFWWEWGKDVKRTSLIVDPPDGKLPPMTPEGEKRRAAEVEHRRTHAFEDPEVFPLGERCVNFGIPRVTAGYNSYIQIVQSPGYIMIMSEMAHDARIIPLDGRPHLDSRIRVWNGDSRAHWDGDTLVIDTTNFSPKSDFMGSHDNLDLTEKLTRVGPDILNCAFTVNDPTMWTAPWTAMIPLKLKNEAIYEYACHEGNDAIPNMLRGHRYEERQLAGTKSQQK